MQILFIDSNELFLEHFNQFKKDSQINNDSHPIFHIGLDCEFISKNNYPNSYEESIKWTQRRTYDISVCILQFANSKACLVIDMTKLGPILCTQLEEILKSGNWIKTGVGIDMDITYLSDNFQLGQCNGCIDLRTFGLASECQGPNLEFINDVYNFDPINKKQISAKSVNDWTQPLTVNQLKYASNDAIASYNIGSKLVNSFISSFKNDLKNYQESKTTKTIIVTNDIDINYVGKLQEIAQKNKLEFPKYLESLENGAFTCECHFENISDIGYGQNKKMAKSESARKIYEYCCQYNKKLIML